MTLLSPAEFEARFKAVGADFQGAAGAVLAMNFYGFGAHDVAGKIRDA